MKPASLLTNVAGFIAFSHLWTWSFWFLAAVVADSVWDWPAVPFFYIGGAGVLIGGLVMTRVSRGVAGLRDLLRRSVDPRPVPGVWWLVVLGFYPLLALAAAALAAAGGADAAPFDLARTTAIASRPASLLTMIVFVLVIGPLPEEIGWRGYLHDRLRKSRGFIVAALLVAVAWWSWHLPLFLLPGYFDAFQRPPPTPLDFALNILPAAVLYAWIYERTGRSVLAVIVFHFMENFTSELLGLHEAVRPYRLALMAAAAVLVAARNRR